MFNNKIDFLKIHLKNSIKRFKNNNLNPQQIINGFKNSFPSFEEKIQLVILKYPVVYTQ